ncbi:MAG: hypothetical protein IJ106_13050 [Parasporobacterium sp.]|nr:hypothetical protein [Parasporobacterium sp.]
MTDANVSVSDAKVLQDIGEYLWEISTDMDDEAFELARSRNYKIVKEMEPLFTEESFHKVYVASVHLNQNKEGAREEFVEALQNLEQVKSVAEGITFLWDAENMPNAGDKEYAEEELDAGQLDGYGFVPYMINYLLEDPSEAKGNVLLFSGGSRTNDGEGFPAAEVFQALGYNAFVVDCRMNPYSQTDVDMDTMRAIRLVKYLGEQEGWGGMDCIALCGFSAGGLKVIDVIENAYFDQTPVDMGALSYVPDEIDAIDGDFNVGILVYTGNDRMLTETGHWPALFMVAGSEDATGATQRLENYYDYTKDIVPSQLIVYEGAGHGFGVGQEGAIKATGECAQWPTEADVFMQENRGYHQAAADGAEMKEDTESVLSAEANIIGITSDTGSVTVEYYGGTEILQTEEDGNILVQVPEGVVLDNISIYASAGEIDIIGVIADTYNLETVDGDMNVYLPEDQAFHLQLRTISDLFESDFLYDVGDARHEYYFGEDGVNIDMETIIGVGRVMILQ